MWREKKKREANSNQKKTGAENIKIADETMQTHKRDDTRAQHTCIQHRFGMESLS